MRLQQTGTTEVTGAGHFGIFTGIGQTLWGTCWTMRKTVYDASILWVILVISSEMIPVFLFFFWLTHFLKTTFLSSFLTQFSQACTVVHF